MAFIFKRLEDKTPLRPYNSRKWQNLKIEQTGIGDPLNAHCLSPQWLQKVILSGYPTTNETERSNLKIYTNSFVENRTKLIKINLLKLEQIFGHHWSEDFEIISSLCHLNYLTQNYQNRIKQKILDIFYWHSFIIDGSGSQFMMKGNP